MCATSDILFTTSEGESLATLAGALGRCYGAFEERMAELAAGQGVPWPDRLPDNPPDAESLAEICRVQDIDLAHCVLAREGSGGPIVGVALLGRRGDRGWLGDFAVAPERRGQGLGHRLMAAFLEQARSLGIRQVEFDVLAVNTPALRVYEAAGFRRDQRMERFVANARDLRLEGALAAGVRVAPLAQERLPAWFAETMAGQPPPCWERDLPSLLAYGDARAAVVSEAGEEMAALVYISDRQPTGAGQPLFRIMFAGLRAGAAARHLRALLAEALREAGTEAIAVAGLEPIDSRLAGLLRELGFRHARPSFNMRREL